MNKPLLLLSLVSASLAACVSPDAPLAEGEARQDTISINGTSVSGVALSGSTPGGSSLTNATLAKVSTAGTLSGGGAVTASSTTAPPWSGSSLVGSTWNATASNGAALKLRIDRATQGTAPNADLWFYAVSYQTSTAWVPLCGLDTSSQPIAVVAAAGIWSTVGSDTASYGASSSYFSLGCRAKSVAKCVELGYKTFKGYTNQMSSCVRMLRADYCGTGATYTVDGTSINVFDNVGLQPDNQPWTPEAEWTPTGARCISSSNKMRYELTGTTPSCAAALKTASCGTTFANGAILIDELNPI